MERKKLPVGIENFEEIRKEGFYYVDKTGLIRDLLNNWGKVNLFTRPRRFGKTLNMSMLKSFFEIGTDKTLFNGLAISKEKALCEAYMGKFPVVFVSLKGVDGLTFDEAESRFIEIIGSEAERFSFLQLLPHGYCRVRSALQAWNHNTVESDNHCKFLYLPGFPGLREDEDP